MTYEKEKTFEKAEREMDKKVEAKTEEPKQKSWGDYFTEPVESLYLVMDDNQLYKYTSHEGETIDLNTGRVQEWLKRVNKLKEKDYDISKIRLIMHNHLSNSEFSEPDHRTYRDLKGHGFAGHFLMYSNLSKTIRSIDKVSLDKPNNE